MRLILCVLLFGLVLVGQCVRINSNLRNHFTLERADNETVDVWLYFGLKADLKSMEKCDWTRPQNPLMGFNGAFNRRFKGEVKADTAIGIHNFPKDYYVKYFPTFEEEMFNYLLSEDFDNRILFFYSASDKQQTGMANNGKGITIMKPSDFKFSIIKDKNNNESFYVASEYDFKENNLKAHQQNKTPQDDMFTKAFENVWRQFWSPEYTNKGQNKSWLQVGYAWAERVRTEKGCDMVYNVKGFIAVNNIPQDMLADSETERDLIRKMRLSLDTPVYLIHQINANFDRGYLGPVPMILLLILYIRFLCTNKNRSFRNNLQKR
eukprot:Platyproteum_vivax@DN7482_c0_g1_i14.p1